jgi:hypothetical protein
LPTRCSRRTTCVIFSESWRDSSSHLNLYSTTLTYTLLGTTPLFKAFDNPGIFRHIVQYLLVKKKYFVAVNENARDIGHRGQFCRIEMKSRYRWLPNQGGVGIVDGEEDYMTTEIIPMFTPSMSAMWTSTGSYGDFKFAIDNDSGTIAMSLFCGNNHFITLYAPGQDPKFAIIPQHSNVIDMCVVKTTVFVSTIFSFGRVDFAVEEPRYTQTGQMMFFRPFFRLAKTDRFVFGLRGRSDEGMRNECKEIDCFELTTNGMPELKHSWIIRSPNENPGVYLSFHDFSFPTIVDQGDSFCVVFMTPNCNRDASLIHTHEVNENDGNVGVWMLTRIIVSKLQNVVIEEVRLPLDGVTEVRGMIIRESVIIGDDILIAAGRHGLLTIPLLFDSDTRPREIYQQANNQTTLGVQLFNNITYVFVKGEVDNDIDSYTIFNLHGGRPIPTGVRAPVIERLEEQELARREAASYERMM